MSIGLMATTQQILASFQFPVEVLERALSNVGTLDTANIINAVVDATHDTICLFVGNGRSNCINLEALDNVTARLCMSERGIEGITPDLIFSTKLEDRTYYSTVDVTTTFGDPGNAAQRKYAKYAEKGRPLDHVVACSYDGAIVSTLYLGEIWECAIVERLDKTKRMLARHFTQAEITAAMNIDKTFYRCKLFDVDAFNDKYDEEQAPTNFDLTMLTARVNFKRFEVPAYPRDTDSTARYQRAYDRCKLPLLGELLEVGERWSSLQTISLDERIYRPDHCHVQCYSNVPNKNEHVIKNNFLAAMRNSKAHLEKHLEEYGEYPKKFLESNLPDPEIVFGLGHKQRITPGEYHMTEDLQQCDKGVIPFGDLSCYLASSYDGIDNKAPYPNDGTASGVCGEALYNTISKTRGFIHSEAVRTACENFIGTNHFEFKNGNCRIHPIWHGEKDRQYVLGFIIVPRAHMKSQSGLKNPQIIYAHFTPGFDIKGFYFKSHIYKGSYAGRDGLWYISSDMFNCNKWFNLIGCDRFVALAVGRYLAELAEGMGESQLGAVTIEQITSDLGLLRAQYMLILIKLFWSESSDEGMYPILRNMAKNIVASNMGYEVYMLNHEDMYKKWEDCGAGPKSKMYYSMLTGNDRLLSFNPMEAIDNVSSSEHGCPGSFI